MSTDLSVLQSARGHAPDRRGYPHVVLRDALPEEVVTRIEAAFPDQEAIVRGRPLESNRAYRLGANRVLRDASFPPLVRDFFDYHTSTPFWRDIVNIFGADIRRQHPELERRIGRSLEDWRVGVPGTPDCDAHADCLWVINSPVTGVSRVKDHHIDFPDKIFSGLLYLRDPADPTPGGELEIYAWRREPRFLRYTALEQDLDLIERVPYQRNLFCGFMNSADSVHGISPRPVTERLRRYINFIVELPFDVFPVPQANLLTRGLAYLRNRTRGAATQDDYR